MTADTVELDALAAGDDVATDLISTKHYQQIKMVGGAIDDTTTIAAGGGVEANALRVTVASDSTGQLTVDGTVTANLSATDNAVLDAIDAVLDAINAKLVTGTIIGDVNLGATDNAVLDAIAASVAGTLTVDLGANNDVTVTGTVTANLSATDNAVLDAIDAVLDTINAKLVTGTVIGDVNLGATDNAVLDSIDAAVTAIQAAAETTDNSIKVDDAAFTLTTDSVNMAGAIRDDTLSTLAAVEGDSVPLRVGSTGALHVTGAGGGTQYTIDDAAPTVVTMAGAIRDDSLTTLTEADGDASTLRVSSTGALHVTGGGGGTEYTEDVATPATQVGTATMMERDDALSTVTPIEGDWIGLRGSAEGALWTQDFNSDAMAASLSGIDTSLNNIEGAVGGNHIDDAAFTLGTDEGVMMMGFAGTQSVDANDAAALACDTDGALHISDGGNSITVDGTVSVTGVSTETTAAAILADTAAMDTNLATLAGAVAGTEVQVDIVSGGTGSTQYAEDTVHNTGDTGTMVLGVRNDTLAALAGTDGDYAPVQVNATGALYTTVDGTVTVDLGANNDVTVTSGAITETNSGAILADTASMDTNLGTVAGAVSGTEMQVDIVTSALPTGAATSAGQLPDGHNVTIDNASGASAVNIQDGGNTITVDGTVGVSGTVTVDLGANNDVTVTSGSITADLGANNDVTVQGEVAHDAAASGADPVIMGARATNSVEGLTQVANADASYIATDLTGVTLSRPHCAPEEHISERISNTNGTSTAFTNFAAAGAGIHNYITDITVLNTSATDGYVDIRDGTGGSVIWTLPLPATGGATHSFSLPLKGAANTALAFDVSAALTTVYISVNGFSAQG